jgi:steroid delta-isomerase-like uncharacterized protein
MSNVIEIAKAGITAYNDKDWSKAKELLAPDAVYDEKGTHRRIEGAGEIIQAWQGWARAFPDSKATFVREFASGDTAILEIVWKGVHTGPLQTPTGTIPPSNKSIEMPACEGVRVEDGKIKSGSHYFDMLTMLLRSVPCRTLALLRERGGKPAGSAGGFSADPLVWAYRFRFLARHWSLCPDL